MFGYFFSIREQSKGSSKKGHIGRKLSEADDPLPSCSEGPPLQVRESVGHNCLQLCCEY